MEDYEQIGKEVIDEASYCMAVSDNKPEITKVLDLQVLPDPCFEINENQQKNR